MIRIIIDWDKLRIIKQKIIKKLIVKRAYKGYCAWLKTENVKPLPFLEFSKFDFWKIEIAFRQYFGWVKKQDYNKAKINFKSVIVSSL